MSTESGESCLYCKPGYTSNLTFDLEAYLYGEIEYDVYYEDNVYECVEEVDSNRVVHIFVHSFDAMLIDPDFIDSSRFVAYAEYGETIDTAYYSL